MTEKYLRPEDVADILHLSQSHLARWRWEQVGPAFVKLGGGKAGKVLYSESEIETFIKSRTHVNRPLTTRDITEKQNEK